MLLPYCAWAHINTPSWTSWFLCPPPSNTPSNRPRGPAPTLTKERRRWGWVRSGVSPRRVTLPWCTGHQELAVRVRRWWRRGLWCPGDAPRQRNGDDIVPAVVCLAPGDAVHVQAVERPHSHSAIPVDAPRRRARAGVECECRGYSYSWWTVTSSGTPASTMHRWHNVRVTMQNKEVLVLHHRRQGRSLRHWWSVRWLGHQQGEDTQGSAGVKPSHRLVVEGNTHVEPLGSIP